MLEAVKFYIKYSWEQWVAPADIAGGDPEAADIAGGDEGAAAGGGAHVGTPWALLPVNWESPHN